MKIAIIGAGNVGSALGQGFLRAGHSVTYGVRDPAQFKGKEAAEAAGIPALPIADAVAPADVVVLSTPGHMAVEVAHSLGDVKGKIIIDTMNAIGKRPEGFSNTTAAVLAHCNTTDVVKCFNTTGAENMRNPVYEGQPIDMFMAGPSRLAKDVAANLAREIGFGETYDFGGEDRLDLIEQMALCWINLAMFQGHGRHLAFKVLKRD